MKQKERNNRNLIIIGLCAIVAIMAVGYAAFASQLTINATSSVTSSWCVGFDSTKTNTYVPSAGITGGTVPTGSIGFDGNVCDTSYKTVANLSASFKQPGDKIVYTLTIANRGSLNAAIKSIIVDGDSVTSNTTKTKGNITFTINMPESTSITAGGTTTMTVEAKFQNERDITGPYAPGEEESIEVLINAEQDDGSGGFTPTPISNKLTGTIYRNNTNRVSNNGFIAKYELTNGSSKAGEFSTEEDCIAQREINLNQGMPATYICQRNVTLGIGEYTNDPTTLNKTYYLKHDIVDDKIIASYACFVYNNAEHCMKGGDSESFSLATQQLREYQLFYNLPDNLVNGCSFTDSQFSSCAGGDFDSLFVYLNGRTRVEYIENSKGCRIDGDGLSYCY